MYQFVEEAEVEQVYNGVFNIINVDIYWQLVVSCFGIQYIFFVFWVSVVCIVLGGFYKGVESVGFMQCWYIVNGSFCLFWICFNWVVNVVYYYIFWQDYWQLVVWGWYYGIVFQCYYWNWCVLVMLMRNILVVQVVVYFMFVNVYCSQFIGDGVEGCFMVKIVEFVRVEQYVFFSQGLLRKIWFRVVSCQDNWFDVQVVFRGKFVVVLVVIWNCYNCVCVVFY